MLRPRVVVTRNLPALEAAVEAIGPEWDVWVNPGDAKLSTAELFAATQHAAALVPVGDTVTRELIEQTPELKVVSAYGAGVDKIDLVAARDHEVAVANIPDEVTVPTAELTMGLILACTRRIVEADTWLRANNPFAVSLSAFSGTDLNGKILGVIGMGRIGQAVAKFGTAFGMDVVFAARSEKSELACRHGYEQCSVDEVMSRADVITLHIPGGAETYRIVNRGNLDLMKHTAIIVNTSRGSVLDEAALAEVLASGRIAAAGLDVFEDEPQINRALIGMSNVVLTPHIGSQTMEARVAMTFACLKNVQAVLTGEEPSDRVV